jgi:hypothetical protein
MESLDLTTSLKYATSTQPIMETIHEEFAWYTARRLLLMGHGVFNKADIVDEARMASTLHLDQRKVEYLLHNPDRYRYKSSNGRVISRVYSPAETMNCNILEAATLQYLRETNEWPVSTGALSSYIIEIIKERRRLDCGDASLLDTIEAEGRYPKSYTAYTSKKRVFPELENFYEAPLNMIDDNAFFAPIKPPIANEILTGSRFDPVAQSLPARFKRTSDDWRITAPLHANPKHTT